MCGLFGGYNPKGLSEDDKNNIIFLGELSKRRGTDSTGIFTVEPVKVKKRGRWVARLRKDTVPATDFFEDPNTEAMLKPKDVMVIAGHTRYATHGRINIANAHPFEIGHFVGMHNGIIADLHDRKLDKTDSRVLYEMINRKGVVPALEWVNANLVGYMALAFLNKSNHKLCLYTNGGRDLFLGKLGTTWYWASEKGFLEKVSKKWDILQPVGKDNLISIGLGTKTWSIKEVKNQPEIAPWEEDVDPNTYSMCFLPSPSAEKSTTRKVETYRGMFKRTLTPVGLPNLTTNTSRDEADKHMKEYLSSVPLIRNTTVLGEVKTPLKTMFRTTPGNLYDVANVRRIIKAGCSCCTKVDERALSGSFYFYSKEGFICQSCYTDDQMVGTFYHPDELHLGVWIKPDGTEVVVRRE